MSGTANRFDNRGCIKFKLDSGEALIVALFICKWMYDGDQVSCNDPVIVSPN